MIYLVGGERVKSEKEQSLSGANARTQFLFHRKFLVQIKALKTLVWHLSRESMKEIITLKK